VYIAYGRDEQAEEILLDALRTHPQRDALRVKLLEIHAARKDRPKFGALAAELRVRTHGAGSEWERAAQLGRQLDPGNRLYEPSVPSGTAASKPADERPYAAPPDAPASSPVEDFSLRLEGMLEERRHDEGRPASPPQETLPARDIDFRLEGFDATTPPSGPSADEAALGTKLELAQACRDIGDREGARELLGEVVRSGHPEFARRAQSLLEQLA
jgi:pilus assembly protein FimV